MPVTELAILPLKPNTSITDPSFRAKLLQSKRVMQNALGVSGRQFVYYRGMDDSTFLYLLGDWQSPSEHWDQFIPSPENQQLLELLKNDFEIPHIQMYHVNVPIASVPAAGAPVICIGWYRVRAEDKAMFETQAVQCARRLMNENLTLERKVAGGWRLEKLRDRESEEEWVLFGGCGKNVEEHNDSSGSWDCQTEPWKGNDHLSRLVLSSELKCVTRIDLEPEHADTDDLD